MTRKPDKAITHNEGGSSKAVEKFTLRFANRAQKTQLQGAAKKNMRSLNAEILFRLFREDK